MAACRPSSRLMKTHQLEIQKFKAAANNLQGQVVFKVDALVVPRTPAVLRRIPASDADLRPD